MRAPRDRAPSRERESDRSGASACAGSRPSAVGSLALAGPCGPRSTRRAPAHATLRPRSREGCSREPPRAQPGRERGRPRRPPDLWRPRSHPMPAPAPVPPGPARGSAPQGRKPRPGTRRRAPPRAPFPASPAMPSAPRSSVAFGRVADRVSEAPHRADEPPRPLGVELSAEPTHHDLETRLRILRALSPDAPQELLTGDGAAVLLREALQDRQLTGRHGDPASRVPDLPSREVHDDRTVAVLPFAKRPVTTPEHG